MPAANRTELESSAGGGSPVVSYEFDEKTTP